MKKQFRVYLRALEPDDYILIHKWRNDPEVNLLFSGTRRFTSTLNEKKWVEDKIFDKNNLNCAVILKETNEMIGCTFIYNIDMLNQTGQSSIFIGEKQHWAKGFATDAYILILKNAFYDKNLQRIWALIFEDNASSLKLHENCGYKVEGLCRKTSYVNGEFKNAYLVAVLKEDFDNVLEQYDI